MTQEANFYLKVEFLQFNSLFLLKGLCKGIDEDLVKGTNSFWCKRWGI